MPLFINNILVITKYSALRIYLICLTSLLMWGISPSPWFSHLVITFGVNIFLDVCISDYLLGVDIHETLEGPKYMTLYALIYRYAVKSLSPTPVPQPSNFPPSISHCFLFILSEVADTCANKYIIYILLFTIFLTQLEAYFIHYYVTFPT